ncbi:peptide chain release factor N(5)-glutamine methyltransferase [Rhodobacterales bacterium HKCCE3408]|nr:peptide chain release factor N(5)-glutamine methyltransferase [Rhodobacterales bacterium HKCCE3408]
MRAAIDSLAPMIGQDEARRDVRMLMAAATGWTSAGVAARRDEPLADAAPHFDQLLGRRLCGQSVAHILGQTEFYGRTFDVGMGDLAPRPDTETLIDLALSDPWTTLLDLGTGTGIIAITLLLERPEARGLATDLRADWYGTARANAQRMDLGDRLTFLASDWFARVSDRFDLIVSNPPYVTEADYATLQTEIAAWERREALTPGGDGLDAYRAIAAGAPAHLTRGGRLLVEIGHDQGEAVAALFTAAGLEDVAVHPDINGKDRVVSARSSA